METLSSSVCRSCRVRLSTVSRPRAFSSTALQKIVPPESPHYIDIPASYQAALIQPRRQKGVLPVPREVFPANRPDKPTQSYLDNVTKSPHPQNVKPANQQTELDKYRIRMAETRKRNLREGLTELYKRKQNITSKMASRSLNRQSERARLISQSEREDSRLTSVSTPIAMRPIKSSTPILDDLQAAKTIYERKKANYERVAAVQQEERLDALHTLYMNARFFITSEKQLDEAIEDAFSNKLFISDIGEGKSMWNHGPPDTISEMIANTKAGTGSTAGASGIARKGTNRDAKQVRFDRDQERLRRIAEKLSGGKI